MRGTKHGLSLRDRLLRQVEKEGDCWMWRGALLPNGYGYMKLRTKPPKNDYPHRVIYLLAKGPIPSGYEVDHLCFNRACVNPDHLEAVTKAENNRRRMERGR